MRAADRLILMPCSDTKLDYAHQPRHLYLGPMWQTLRTHIGRIGWKNVFVLSGRFGFITAETHIQTYNEPLTAEKADRTIARGIFAPNDHYGACTGPGRSAIDTVRPPAHAGLPPIQRVLNAGAGHYARVFDAFVAELQGAGIVAETADVTRVRGGIGEQRSQLGSWLKGNQ